MLGMGDGSCPFEFNFDPEAFKVGDVVSYRVPERFDDMPFVGTLTAVPSSLPASGGLPLFPQWVLYFAVLVPAFTVLRLRTLVPRRPGVRRSQWIETDPVVATVRACPLRPTLATA